MNLLKSNEEAFTGLEAAIVLIAFIVVASVFGYVVLGAGFFATQKSQETIHTGIQQTTSGVQPSGMLSIQADGAGTGISSITFYLQLAAGGTGADMSKFSYTVSTPTLIKTYSAADVVYSWAKVQTGTDTAHWQTCTPAGDSITHSHCGLLATREMVYVTIIDSFDSTEMGVNTKFLVEVKPPIGAPVSIGGTVPAGMAANMWYEVY